MGESNIGVEAEGAKPDDLTPADKIGRVKGYLKKLIPILILVQIVDAYTSVVIENIGSKIIMDFDITNSVFALMISIASIGMYFVFANQYFSDKFGRKPLLITTVLGMSLCCLLLMFSTSPVDFVISIPSSWASLLPS